MYSPDDFRLEHSLKRFRYGLSYYFVVGEFYSVHDFRDTIEEKFEYVYMFWCYSPSQVLDKMYYLMTSHCNRDFFHVQVVSTKSPNDLILVNLTYLICKKKCGVSLPHTTSQYSSKLTTNEHKLRSSLKCTRGKL